MRRMVFETIERIEIDMVIRMRREWYVSIGSGCHRNETGGGQSEGGAGNPHNKGTGGRMSGMRVGPAVGCEPPGDAWSAPLRT